MGLRFRKSIKIAPGVRVNVGKKSSSISFGGKGMRYTISSTGRKTTSVGIPGTGIYYTSSSGKTYKTKAYQRQDRLQQEAKRIQKEQEVAYAKLQVEMFENQCELIRSIHKECDDEIDREKIMHSSPPFKNGKSGPREKEAQQKLDNFRPTFFQKLFGRVEKEINHLQKEVEEARLADLKCYHDWEKMVYLAKKVLAGDIDTYLQVIEEMDPLRDLLEFGSGFEFGTNDPTFMEVEFDVHSESVVPKEEKRLTKTGKLSTRQMTKTRYYDLQQDYVCSCVIRIARDLFALLPIETVLIHAYDEQLNTVTGHNERNLILSAKIDRETLNQLNFELIDCSDAMENFPHHMHFRKTKGFAPVEKVQ